MTSTTSVLRFNITPAIKPLFSVPPTDNSADIAKRLTDLLQQNHNAYHVFFNKGRYHNHILHHLLAIYPMGATPEELIKAYDGNAHYQKPRMKVHDDVFESLSDPETYKRHLGDETKFQDFLEFFVREIQSKGVEQVLHTYLFADNDFAYQLFARLFAGLLHSLIHLGYALEYNQPLGVAEALAEAAVNEDNVANLFLATEEAAKKDPNSDKTLAEIHKQIFLEKVAPTVVMQSDENKTRNGVMKRGMDIVPPILAQWKVRADNLQLKTAEMYSHNLLVAAAQQNPKHAIKTDFNTMHHTNCAFFFPLFATHPAIPTRAKVRLLQWKGWFDIVNYISSNAPQLYYSDIVNYRPRHPEHGWAEIFHRANTFPDDGHTPKLVRSIAGGERFCSPYFERKEPGIMVEPSMWLQMAHMAIDSPSNGGIDWVRNCGWEESWKTVPARPGGNLIPSFRGRIGWPF